MADPARSDDSRVAAPAVEPRARREPEGAALGALAEATPRADNLGLYVHVPFCAQRCDFCSFNTAPLEDGSGIARYRAALAAELAMLARAPWARGITLATIFLGGGTPSVLAVDDLAAILDAVRGRFTLAPGAEVTVECNPESVDRPKLEGYRAAGVTRVSLGVQSLDDAILPVLGRLHSAAGARAAFDAARAAGFTDVSVDLMYGLPGLDADGWTRTVDAVLDWAPDHLSAYGLTLDAGSVWGARGVAGLPPEETVVAQYWRLARAAAARGYEHYEISNYARPGHRSRHNQIYWRRGEYLAAGPGACGFVGDLRYANARAVARYCRVLEEGALPIDEHERLTPDQAHAERLFLGLRTADGVSAGWLAARIDTAPALGARVAVWREAALLVESGGRVRLTEAGFLVSDALFVDVL
jgi:oxygen-independent coproporphyrinogen-3 oxidase